MDRIRVLLLVPNLRVSNGVTSFVMSYFNHLDHDKVQMDFALYSDRETPYYEQIRKNGGKIFILPNIKKISQHIRVCNKILKEGNYDIIHNNTLHIALPMMFCAMQQGVPVRILHSHNSKLGETPQKEIRNKMLLPLLLALSTDYAACSELAGRAMFGAKSYTVIPNVISTEKYKFDSIKRNKVRAKMNAADKIVIGTVGRLAPQKNPFFAIDVFKEFLKLQPSAEYWWIGSGPLDKQVADYVEAQGLTKSVKLLGSRNDTVDLYQGMDVFFLPSLFEGLPVTGVEAQAMGLSMVVSDTVTNEMVYTSLVDYVSLDESPKIWAGHLKGTLNHKIDRRKYSIQLIQSNYSDIGCGDKLTNIYKKLL